MFLNLPRAYWFLFLGTFVNRLGGFVLPFLTFYLTSERGVSASLAALVVSTYGAGSFVSQLTGGELTDRLGRRPVMLISFLAAPIAMVALGFARDLAVISAVSFFLGFLTEMYRPAVSAAVADLVPTEDRTRAYGYIYWAINLGFAIAPVLAGLLAGRGYIYLFLGDALTTFLFGLIVLFAVRETRPAEAVRAAHAGPRQRLAELRRAPILLLFSLLALFFGMIYMQGHVSLPLDMQADGLGPKQYGAAIAVNGILIVIINLPVSNVIGKWPRFPTVAAAAVLIGLGFGVTAFADAFWFFAFSIVIWTLGEILGSAVAPAIVADLSPIELRGLFQGVFGAAWGLAAFLGPMLGGWVYERYGSSALWGGCFALGCLVALGYLGLGRFAHPKTVQT
ncbi:MAG: MFS transporter [Chloroflexota bacterium]